MDIKSYIEANKARFREELFSLIRIPSISSDSSRKADMEACAAVGGNCFWLPESIMPKLCLPLHLRWCLPRKFWMRHGLRYLFTGIMT